MWGAPVVTAPVATVQQTSYDAFSNFGQVSPFFSPPLPFRQLYLQRDIHVSRMIRSPPPPLPLLSTLPRLHQSSPAPLASEACPPRTHGDRQRLRRIRVISLVTFRRAAAEEEGRTRTMPFLIFGLDLASFSALHVVLECL